MVLASRHTAAAPARIAIDLPADDDSADLTVYADTVVDAVAGKRGPLILVAQSIGAFTAPMVAARAPTAEIVLVNPMVPAAGESAGQWWAAEGRRRTMWLPQFDPVEDFFHDVPESVRAEAFRQGAPRQSDTPFGQPWPLDGWPDVPTRVIQGGDDRLVPRRLPATDRARATRSGHRRDARRASDGAEPARRVGIANITRSAVKSAPTTTLDSIRTTS